MLIHVTKFVLLSDLFEGLTKACEEFCDMPLDMSFGDNNRTLVDPNRIEGVIELMHNEKLLAPEDYLIIKNRLCEAAAQEAYVDLEN